MMTECINLNMLELSEKLPRLRENVKRLNDRFMAFLNIKAKMQRAKAETIRYAGTDSWLYCKQILRGKNQFRNCKTVKNRLEKKNRNKGKMASFWELFKRLSTWKMQSKEKIDEELIPLDLFDVSCDMT